MDLFPAPDIYERGTYRARKPLKLPELGNALTACKGWWAEEFTFRGFGIGFVKPVFRGLLLRPDLGVGVRLPVTLHFRSWESREALPSVALSLFVLWPPAVQVSQAMSYPAELLQELATTAARKVVVPSKEAIQVGDGCLPYPRYRKSAPQSHRVCSHAGVVACARLSLFGDPMFLETSGTAVASTARKRQNRSTRYVSVMRMNASNMPQVRRRKEAVQRLGVSIGVRYSSTYGFQWWLSPYFFLLPGVRVLWTLYQSMMTLLLSSLALMQRCVAPWMLVSPFPCEKHEELCCSAVVPV